MKKQPSIEELKAKVKSGEISLDDANAILKPKEDAFSKQHRQERLADCEPPQVDDTLFGMIEDGSVELTDTRFFELLKRDTSLPGDKTLLKENSAMAACARNELYENEEGKKEQRQRRRNF